ncbi:MAG: hypothetical protein LBW77_04625 [Verrucomicrobiota bacterium]|jgi:hypothetical protein|nr:hypothetical protein [Verrucomicrobiota bacterium]
MMKRFLSRLPKPATFQDFSEPDAFKIWMKWATVAAAAVCVAGLLLCAGVESCRRSPAVKAPPAEKDGKKAEAPPPPDVHKPVREAPASFPPDSNLPRGKEIYASGPIELGTFDAMRDLVRFEDARVWFNSDQKQASDREDDHLIHRAMEVPLKRLVNLLEKKGGKLKVQDTYRPAEKNPIHLPTSLHCEGRAIDLTCEGVGLGELAKLCWQSGFDFVLYEVPKTSGIHLHCSVKRSPDAPLPPRPAK